MGYKETFYLAEFKNNDYMLWSVCSQCYNTFTVRILDDKKEYAKVKKSNTSTDVQKLEQKADFYGGGGNLRVEVEFNDHSVDIKESIISGGVVDAHSNTVGYSYTYCLEDWEDEDYNDVYITITAWRKKG